MDLQDYGFVACGRWVKSTTVNSQIAFEISDFERERVVYAFVVDGEPKHIGICEKAKTNLKDRMKRYQHLQGAGTNERIANTIRQCLEKNKTVQIFVLKPASNYRYEDLNIDLVKGLDNPLIEKFKPEWNRLW